MKNWVLLALVVALLVVPFVVHRPSAAPEPSSAAATAKVGDAKAEAGEKPEPFQGADDRASKLIESLRPGYKPWAKPLFEPPSGEVESALFAIQAALGAGVLFYYLGYAKGRSAKAEAVSSAGKPSAAS